MAKEQIPITPAVLTWARTRAGYSLEEASKTFKKIEAWERGDAFPTYPQLERLADTFKLPVAVFFFPEEPKAPPIKESFRTLPDAEFDELPRRIRFLLRKAKAFQLNLAELASGDQPQRLITRDLVFDLSTEVAEMARQVRHYLNVSLEDQRAWRNVDEALDQWRQVLADAGVFVFKDAFQTEEFSGFCLYDDSFPIIYVNNSTTKTRQIFTLFHELAHLLFRTSGIDTIHDEFVQRLPRDAKRIEIVCNQFAAEFLVPEAAFEQAMVGRQASEVLAQELASGFHVSRETIFRKFLDRGLISAKAYNDAARRWSEQKKKSSGGDYYNTQIVYLGPKYIGLAMRRYYQGRISDIKLAEYLSIAPKSLAEFESRLARRRA